MYAKTKMISLRLSTSEYEALKSMHLSGGARNVSELARSAIRRMIARVAVPMDDPIQAQLIDLHHRVLSLESVIGRLAGADRPPADC